jgi:putative SOS response-associated peptidase YedK
MCFFFAATLDALAFAKKRGMGTDVIERLRNILAVEERLFETERKKKAPFFDTHIAEKAYVIPAYAKPQCVIVTPDRQLQVMRWGLKPRGASPEALARYAIQNWFVNANGERIFTEKTYPYHDLIATQRCLIPATGFIEHHWVTTKNKQPYYIEIPGRPQFMMAGLYEVTPIPGKGGHPGGGLDLSDPDFENYFYTFVQITTDATPEMAEIHNGGQNPHRMPMILREQDEAAWLDLDTPMTVIKSLIKPYDEHSITARPIDKKFLASNSLAKETVDPAPVQSQLNFE